MPTTRTRKPRPSVPLQDVTLADLLKRLGGISAARVRLHPSPGTATEKDVIRALDRENRPCELVDGTLVEKAMGYEESEIAAYLILRLYGFVLPQKLGLVTTESGPMRLFSGLVRMPDVAFVSWDRLPGRRVPKTPIPHLAPDLAVEVLSKSNTKAEMARKLGEYFQAGVRLVWLVDPKTRTVRVHTAVDQSVLLEGNQTLDGGEVLPGFSLSLNEIFARNDS